jgi:hypothetical protein
MFTGEGSGSDWAGVHSDDMGSFGSALGSHDYTSLGDRSRELVDFVGDDWAAYIFIGNKDGQGICIESGSEPSLVEIDQASILVTWFEFFMFGASCIAAYRHFKEAGRRFRYSWTLIINLHMYSLSDAQVLWRILLIQCPCCLRSSSSTARRPDFS